MAFTLRPRGPFSLAAAASFADGFPGTDAQHAHSELQFAWPVDEDWRTVAATLRQPGKTVRGEFAGTPPDDLARRARGEIERILPLDVDGRGFGALADRDPDIAALQERFAGLAPSCSSRPMKPQPGRSSVIASASPRPPPSNSA